MRPNLPLFSMTGKEAVAAHRKKHSLATRVTELEYLVSNLRDEIQRVRISHARHLRNLEAKITKVGKIERSPHLV